MSTRDEDHWCWQQCCDYGPHTCICGNDCEPPEVTPRPVRVTTADDVTEEMISTAAALAQEMYPDAPVNWDVVLGGLELHHGIYLGTDSQSDAIRKIKFHVRKARREAR